jgi:hypothetical protein
VLDEIDLGNVPAAVAALFGGLSLLLAFLLFRRDHKHKESRQVESLGLWADARYERQLPTDRRVEEAELKFYGRNASDHPLWVRHVRWRVETCWLIPSGEHAYAERAGTRSILLFHDDLQIPPLDTWETKTSVNYAHVAPTDAVQTSIVNGVRCYPESALVRDNSGRRWRIRPGADRRVERITWRSKQREYEPHDWFFRKNEK